MVFDKEVDRLATFLPEFIEEHKLEGKCDEETLKKAIQNAFEKAREEKLKVGF